MIFPILFTLNCSWRGVEDVAPYRVWLKPHSTYKSKFENNKTTQKESYNEKINLEKDTYDAFGSIARLHLPYWVR